MKNILFIDLTSKESFVEERRELFGEFIGGSGVAIKLLHELSPRGVDPFSPENPIIMVSSPLLGLFTSISKTICMFKSPLTGNLGESHAGGKLGLAMKLAGYGAIVITGVAEKPVYLEISSNGKVNIKGASSLLGVHPKKAIELLSDPKPVGLQSIIATGPASEKFVCFANVVVDRHNYFGRLGLGAVFGAKNLKAVKVNGEGKIKIERIDEYKLLFNEIYREAVETNKMLKYHDLGTPANVHALNEIKALPARNFLLNQFEEAEKVSGELYGDNYLIRKVSCPNCPIGCKHIALVRSFFAKQHEIEPLEIPYDYEPIYTLGINLGIGNPVGILKLISACDFYGLDAMMTGTMLSWITEAYEKGMVTKEDTLDIEPRWGDYESYVKIIDYIVKMPNAFYMQISRGKVPEEGRDFFMALGGNGVAGYHTGPAFIIGTLIGARHSHVSNAGYSFDQKHIGEKVSVDEMVDFLISEEIRRCVLESCGVCLFARRIYDWEKIQKALTILGYNYTVEELKEMGRKIYREKYLYKFREGFSFEKLYVPKRFFETSSASGFIEKETIDEALRLAEKRIMEILGEEKEKVIS